jgi:hypothetical protein
LLKLFASSCVGELRVVTNTRDQSWVGMFESLPFL